MKTLKGDETMKTCLKRIAMLVSTTVIVTAFVPTAAAATVDWTVWNSANAGNPGTASGTIGTINVSYSGEISFAQTSGGVNTNGGASTNYWIPSTPYDSGTVTNAPPDFGIIALKGGNDTLNTVTFDTLVTNPVMAISSLGSLNISVQYDFNAPFTLLSAGTGYWGGNSTTLTQSSNSLIGEEGSGIIQFIGTFGPGGDFSSISWTAPKFEDWHGFTVGTVPLPAAVWLFGSGLLGLTGVARRRKTR